MSNRRDRYDVSGLPEAQWEPGSRNKVLKNLQGVKSRPTMDILEAREQIHALEWALGEFDKRHRFTAADVCKIHRSWLKSVYPWAGRYRQVNLSKGDFPFAMARVVSQLMEDFEKDPLRRFTPCRLTSRTELAEALAIVHTEFILIHPFRDGNGRIGRMLAILMAVQAGMPLLDFGVIKGRLKRDYFAAVRAGLEKNYVPMRKVFEKVIQRSLKPTER
jgi:cell filamentation protein